jgi:hypothetical protein
MLKLEEYANKYQKIQMNRTDGILDLYGYDLALEGLALEDLAATHNSNEHVNNNFSHPFYS